MDRNFQLSDADRRHLDRIAALIDGEAQTWREGFAVWDGTVYRWNGSEETEFAHVRCVKLESASAALRKIARADLLGHSPRMEAAVAAE